MPTNRQIICLLRYLSYRHSVLLVGGDNPGKYVFLEDPTRESLGSTVLPAMVANGTEKSVASLSDALQWMTDEEQKKLAERTRKILAKTGDINSAMIEAYSEENKDLKKAQRLDCFH
ncbi:unnamed protein product [Clavelina lepadiformis]|uniref:Uncharacterized protein n=1 Tax=Clavelina lepadiformis TaxID=159417 RepID=A0ABP0F1G5_CLALP